MKKQAQISPIHHTNAPLTNSQWQPVAPEKIINGTPQTTYKILHTSQDGFFTTGIWECTPGKWRTDYATEDEFCTLIEGHVRLTPENGVSYDFHAPESFTIPRGFKGTWEAVTKIRKHFVIYESAAS